MPEDARFACCKPECGYVTVDDVMLLYHVEVQHPELEAFQCKSCPPDADPVSFAELEFHLRCHAELLFKCPFCPYFHWQKRTAERHVADEHPTKRPAVRDVRKDMAEQGSSRIYYIYNEIN